MLRRADRQLANKHGWYDVEQTTVKRFVSGSQMNDLLPLPLTKEHPQRYTEEQMQNFKSKGSYSHDPPEDEGKRAIRRGLLKV